MNITTQEHWTPQWANPKVRAHYTAQEPYSDGMPVEQKVVCDCDVCATHWEGMCLSGNPRQHIQTFCKEHLHRDVMVPQ